MEPMTRQELGELIAGLEQKRHRLDVQVTEIDNKLEDLRETYANMRDFQIAM